MALDKLEGSMELGAVQALETVALKADQLTKKAMVKLGDATQDLHDLWSDIKEATRDAIHEEQWRYIGVLASRIPGGPFEFNKSGNPAQADEFLSLHGNVSKSGTEFTANIWDNGRTPFSSERETHVHFTTDADTATPISLRAEESIRFWADDYNDIAASRVVEANIAGVEKGDLPLSRVIKALQKLDAATNPGEKVTLKDRLRTHREKVDRREIEKAADVIRYDHQVGGYSEAHGVGVLVRYSMDDTDYGNVIESMVLFDRSKPVDVFIRQETTFSMLNGQVGKVVRKSTNPRKQDERDRVTEEELKGHDLQSALHDLATHFKDQDLVRGLSDPTKRDVQPALPNWIPLSYK